MSTFFLPDIHDITTCDKISQAFPFCICILETIKSEGGQSLGMRLYEVHIPVAIVLYANPFSYSSFHYLGVGDADITLYEAILFCGLENRHGELSILLHTFGVISRPVLVAHLL